MHSVTLTSLVPVLVGLVGLDGDLAGDEESFSCSQEIPALHWSLVGCLFFAQKEKYVLARHFRFPNVPDRDDSEGLGWQPGLLGSPLSREETRRARRAWTSWGRRLGGSTGSLTRL